MTATATRILEEFRQLAPAEKRAVVDAIARETAATAGPTGRRNSERRERIRLDPALANAIALSDTFNPEEN